MSGGLTIRITVKVEKARLEQMLKTLRPKADFILDKSAFEIERTAKALAPVDTGALKASIYVTGAKNGTGGSSAAQAAARSAGMKRGRRSGQTRKNIGFSSEPTVGELERAIGPAVDYAIYPETQGQPYMQPAAEANKNNFIRAWYDFV